MPRAASESLQQIEVELGSVLWVGQERIEVRCKEGVKWTNVRITELLNARRIMAGEVPQRVLVVLPEELDFDLSVMTHVHYDPVDLPRHCRAEAWVVRNDLNARLTEVYFKYFPAPVPSAYYLTEKEAVAWLSRQ